MMNLTEELIKDIIVNTCGSLTISYQNREIDFSKPWSRISMKDIVKKYTGIDFDSFSGDFQAAKQAVKSINVCLLYTSPSPRDVHLSRMPSSA